MVGQLMVVMSMNQDCSQNIINSFSSMIDDCQDKDDTVIIIQL